MAIKKRDLTVHEEGDLRRYFAMIPNLIDDMGLDPFAHRLYCHLKRLAKQGNEVEASTRELAEHCRMSPGKVSDAKQTLCERKLISISNDGYRDHITLLDIWRENMLRYANEGLETRSPHEQVGETRSPHERVEREESAAESQTRSPREQDRSSHERVDETRSPREQDRSPHERVPESLLLNIKNSNSINEEEGIVGAAPTAPAPPSDWDLFCAELCRICYGHSELAMLSDDQRGALRAEGKRIREGGYGSADLMRWFEQVWQREWQFQKGKQRPKPHEVRTSIPRLGELTGYSVASDLPAVTFAEAASAAAAVMPVSPPNPHDHWLVIQSELDKELPPDSPARAWLAEATLALVSELAGIPLYHLQVTDPNGVAWLGDRLAITIRKKLTVLLRQRVIVEVVLAQEEPTHDPL